MKPVYLFDSHALLTFFQKEKGAEVVARILNEALQQNTDRLICVMNLGEILYLTKRRFGDEKKLEILGHIRQLGIKILPVPDSLVYQAAELKAEYAISFADCFALACAVNHTAVLVTGDPEFKVVSHLVTIQWIR
jgi:predicted nucleic acid-binding protein